MRELSSRESDGAAPGISWQAAFIIQRLSKVPQPVEQKRPLRREISANSTLFGWHNHCGNRTRSSRLAL
jgi:hypothetical protein